MFYVLTCVENGKENVIGFFSKVCDKAALGLGRADVD
jgi:hypothetical protein